MAPQDPYPPNGQGRGPSPGPNGGAPLRPQPLRPMPVPLQPQPIAAPAPGSNAPVPVAPQPIAPSQYAPQPVNAPQPIAPQPLAPRPVARPAPVPLSPGTASRPILVPQDAEQPRVRAARQADDEVRPEELIKKNAPPWLISLAVQMALVILLGLWMVPQSSREVVELVAGYAEQLGEQLEDDSFTFETELPEESALSLADVQQVEDPFAAPPELAIDPDGNVATTNISAPQIGMALEGRDQGMKEALLSAYGGTQGTESAVQRGLEWLVKHQKGDGSWSMKGPYPDGAVNENTAAATAMAMLAFLGNGHTHTKGMYQKTVDRGMKHLLKMQDKDGNFFQDGRRDQWMYTQGQCTIAICELYAMSRDSALREPAERAVAFVVASQHKAGGWRYAPGSDSDTSVTGWMLMALQSARMAGLEVPKKTLDSISRYLDDAAVTGSNGSKYSYQPGMETSEVMTAEALLCRQWLGWSRNDPRMKKGIEFLLTAENLPNPNFPNVYYWYYATQTMHHVEGDAWKQWNAAMRDMLVGLQVDGGKERGSWSPTKPKLDRWGSQAGRLFQTCLSIYILETYYRHMPLYSGMAGK
jgi:hypothetical protein